MTSFACLEGVDHVLAYPFEISLFNENLHRQLQRAEGWLTFVAFDRNIINNSIHFNLADGVAISPYRAPFGAFEGTNNVATTNLDFISFFENELTKRGIKKISIKLAPLAHTDRSILQLNLLLQSRFTVSQCDISSILFPQQNEFAPNLKYSQRRRLRMGREKGLRFVKADPAFLEEAYHFILCRRREKGYSLSMTVEELARIQTTFPGRVILFALFDGSRLIAASISMLVKHDILYDFYHDHHPEYNRISPVVTLMEGIYSYCKSKGVNVLDLGTSMHHGSVNEGLFTFKRSLGAKPSLRFTLEKTIQ